LPWGGRYNIDYNYVSDADYLDDFGDSLAVSAETHLARRGQIRYRGKQWDLLGRALYFQTLDQTIAPGSRPYAMLPQIRFNLRQRELLGGLNGGLSSEYVRFDRAVGVTGQRFDLYPSLSYPLEEVWGFLRPKLGVRYTGYRLDGEGFDDSESRSLPIMSLDGGLFFERDAAWFGRAATQTLEPRLFYLKVPYRDQDGLPDFDSALLDFGFGRLFRENRFSGGDRVGDANQLSLALSSRVIDRDDGSERFRVGLGTVLYFDDRRVDLNGAGSDSESRSTLVGEAAARFGDHWQLRGGLEWDPDGAGEKTRRSALSLNYRGPEQRLFNLAYRYDDDRLEQGDLSFSQPVGEHFDLVGRWNYSLRENETLEVFGGLEYESCCWKVRAVARRYIKESGGDPDNSVFLQLEMKGLASIGNKLDQFLQRGIFGYEVD
jgi:LPS-assembly protein